MTAIALCLIGLIQLELLRRSRRCGCCSGPGVHRAPRADLPPVAVVRDDARRRHRLRTQLRASILTRAR